jgi:hypothetical protein
VDLVFEHSDGVGSGVLKETELADRAQADAQPRCREPATKSSVSGFDGWSLGLRVEVPAFRIPGPGFENHGLGGRV